MALPEVTQILVNGHRTGIIGLKTAFQTVSAIDKDLSNEAITAELMHLLGSSNYMVPSAAKAYEAAFLREYKKWRGEPVPDETGGPIQIKVLGQGCPSCDKLEQDVMAVLVDIGLSADFEHVRDIREIAAYGVLASPSLVVDGKVLASGRSPSKSQLKEWLLTAKKNESLRTGKEH
jgi:small redox-active disulfide protein 2